MKKLTGLETSLSGKASRIIMLALTIALFVISAAAPLATIGIGK